MTDESIPTIARGLSEAQRRLVIESDPDDITGEEGCGVDITGSLYRVARKLHELGLGDYTHGSFIADMYWNKPLGLAVREHLQQVPATPTPWPTPSLYGIARLLRRGG